MSDPAFGFRCDGVAIGWNDVPIATGIDLRVDLSVLGRRLPILGRSGTGKSTLMYVLAGLKRPLAGRVVWSIPEREPIVIDAGAGGVLSATRDLFGYALQDAPLLPHLTIAENLALPLELRRRGADDERIAAAIESVLTDDEDAEALSAAYPGELSGGQRRRISLAQAMIGDPVVLFADEPGGALDEVTRTEILRVVDRWVDETVERGDPRAFVWITHHRDAVELGRSSGCIEVRRTAEGIHADLADAPSGGCRGGATRWPGPGPKSPDRFDRWATASPAAGTSSG